MAKVGDLLTHAEFRPTLPNLSFSTIFAIALLFVQLVLPWTVDHFVTQDGPSHLYSAVTAKELLTHRHSIQRTLYHLRSGALPNWTSTIVLAGIATVSGVTNAERVMVDLCLLTGFFSFHYAARALAGRPRISYSPLGNFLFHNWFLWLGFYNFIFGMALCLIVIGYFLRHRRSLRIRDDVFLAMGTILVFFTHLIPAAITVAAVLSIAVWSHGRPILSRAAMAMTGVAVALVLPAIGLIGIYVMAQSSDPWPMEQTSEMEKSLAGFPMHVFATAAGAVGGQTLLTGGILLYLFVSTVGLAGREWRSETGAIAAVSFLCFVLYLIVPDAGFGGSIAKIRFAWIVFLFAALAACRTENTQHERAFALYAGVLLSCNLFVTWQALQRTSFAVHDYIAATDQIPRNAVFIRIRYPTPKTTERYGLSFLGRDPFFHLEAYSAARRGSIDLSDYEALNSIFPLAFRASIGPAQQSTLWSLEGPDANLAASLTYLEGTLPVAIEYVVLLSDPGEDTMPGYSEAMRKLKSGMRLFAASPGNFVQVFQRVH